MLPCFKSKLLDQIPHVTHGFFTRNGGVSCGHYATLNTVELKTDNPNHVIENRRRIVETLGGGTLQFNQQTHSTIVHHVKEKTPLQKGDAIITQTPHLLIGVQTADCMPILIAHKTQKIVAAVHAGWKGALTGVVQSTLDELKQMCDPKDLVCVIGPCIATEHLEVGKDVYDLGSIRNPEASVFPVLTGSSTLCLESVNTGTQKKALDPSSQETLEQYSCQAFHKVRENKSIRRLHKDDDKWLLDMRALAAQIIQDYGIVHIDQIQEDTYSQPDKFFSYRRSTHAGEKIFGGQASVIGIL